ncbi:MAG: ABC transporter ATP-binding protein [Alphaproteobacteria bacterium]|nr:ABC transporter ATP-binding protein [Alphaproteobacteria bacterium]
MTSSLPLASLKGGTLILDNITVSYQNIPAIEGVSGVFEASSLTAIVGPNGGGKSTLLKALLGLVPLRQGRVTFQDCKRRDCAYLTQTAQVDRSFPLHVSDVVAMGLCQKQGFFRPLPQDTNVQVTRALERVGLGGYEQRLLSTLSGGQFQKVLFARLCLQNAPIILLDEPFAAVDAYTIEDLIHLIQEWHDEGRTLIVVSHDIELVREFFPSTLVMVGEALAWGPTQDVLTLETLRQAKTHFRAREKNRLHDFPDAGKVA